jgi:hypothetical protein
LSPVNGRGEGYRSRSGEFFRKVDGNSKVYGEDGVDKRDTNAYGLIVDHKARG